MNQEFAYALRKARAKLAPTARPDRQPLRALAAAGFFALTAVAFAATAVLAPPNETIPPARTGVN